ncbi:bifunctional sugar phosphate isomerase/epimerase/4-hydroxyphenylpyruvate dioxygenase family protein [Acidimangrovimonas sediminis]|uniref:bifunctional sugar phosphate isomerase/epimerase/4-hydroxyphenylpyruvate dioxygenase family protein n=1 Tax=Acidimangrovimonas sediminis TaxID=2056283 RepID=UPI000C80C28E|nr:sugar phosphate isomerase/epimerase and 4-hydroxyphenylpyruvate domain-containing protein [Acidimangrovimonas sediminis]
MKTSIATVSVSGNLQEKLEAIAAAGFDGIEIFEQDFLADDRSPREIGRMIREHGLEITLFQPFRDFEGLPEPLRAKAFERAERKFDVMQELGCDLALFCSSCHPQALGGIDRAAADFAELGERAAARGLRVGYEALAWGRHVNDHRDAWEIVRRADHPAIGLILDSFHTLGRGIDPETIRRIPGDRIFFVQLADAPAIEMDLLYWSRHFRNMPGEGDLDVTAFMRAVAATGYAGPISLEIFNDQFRAGRPGSIAQDGYRALINLMDDVRRQEPGLVLDLAPMPARGTVEGTAFLEFASRGEEAETLRALLRTLGFSRVGRHRSKDLGLWQQGTIRILINEETRDFAATAYNVHGTSICDIGLLVASAPDTVARATALGSGAFAQPLSPGQLDIPAIRGLGGSVMHFLDGSQDLAKVWDREFTAQGAEVHPAAGLTRVDHIAQTMTYDEMLSWTLFYTALFEMEKAPMVDVTDPDGLVRSQALEAAGGGLRVTLNGAETHRTVAGAFLSESFGAPVQHVALESADIFASAEALAGRGFAVLPIPPNYYADLAARFDIAPDRLAEMQRLNILYDRSGDGEFFQLYSQTFAGGMFVEIVERRGGYAGYGAPNAPFRIAAQRRLMRGKGMPRR